MSDNGYVIMRKGWPHDVEVWEEDEEKDANTVLKMLEEDNPENRYYIRPVTDREVYQAVLAKSEAM